MKTVKRSVVAGLILGAITAGISGSAMASADIVTLCKSIETNDPVTFEGLFGNIGQCVSFFRTQPVDACQILAEEGRLEENGYANQGECVVDVMS